MNQADLMRKIPQVDAVLRLVGRVTEAWGPGLARHLVREELEKEREKARRGAEPADADAMAARVLARSEELKRRSLRRVVNATGVVLHTNLGRAPLSDDAIEAARAVAGYSTLEFDLASGGRAERAPVAGALLASLVGAEAALVVNNNAAALLLALAALARGREVVVSRGELIEIGGEFRLPEIMDASGAVLREVGTTNRTHAKDYRRAIGERTAMILKVHPSNFQVTGFTKQPTLGDLIAIAHESGIPVLYDIGSGLLRPDARFPDEPDAMSALDAGCDLVCFSGDKLLGGPQAGVLAGRKDLVEGCRRNPIARAVRADKLTLAAMEATALAHATGRANVIPAAKATSSSKQEIEARATRLVANVPQAVVRDGESVTGGGSLPGRTIATALVAVTIPDPEGLARLLRLGDPPVVARIEDGVVVLDLRTVDPNDDDVVAAALRAALERAREG